MPATPDPRDLVARAAAGDEVAFAAAVEPHRRPLFRHCYRMLGSGLDAEEAVQDTLERAWRRLDRYDESGAWGGWLYRIAANVCLDRLRASSPRAVALDDAEGPWVEPIDDERLGHDGDPASAAVRREDISLAFITALQCMPPRQRAALLLHDVLGFDQAEVAEALDVTSSSVNSLLFRARASTRIRPRAHTAVPEPHDPEIRALLARYVRAWELADIDQLVQIVTDDVRFSMPPLPEVFAGRDTVAAFVTSAIFDAIGDDGVPLVAGFCNGQAAFATYARSATRMEVTGLQILELATRHGTPAVSAITSYRDPALATRCGFPAELPT